ncbi:MAG: ribonuclease M5 [Erysipelotrichaceae bacterium]
MKKINEVIVVEGKHDTQALKKIFDCETIETQGTHLSKKNLEFIKYINEKRGIIIFTDPDYPGERIRKIVNAYIPSAKNAFIEKSKAIGRRKVGVEHAQAVDLIEALENVVTFSNASHCVLEYSELVKHKLNGATNSKALRSALAKQLFISECNAKTLWKRLNMLGVNAEQLDKMMEEIQ